MLDQLLGRWKKQNVQALAEMQQLEKARNSLKKRLEDAKTPQDQLDAELKQLDAQQAAARKPLKTALKDSRPVPADLEKLEIANKVLLLTEPSEDGFQAILTAIGERNGKDREQRRNEKREKKS